MRFCSVSYVSRLAQRSVDGRNRLLCAVGFLDIVYLYPYYTAMKVIDTSIVAALFSLGQITIPVMTYLWLDERLSLTQYIGFAIIIMSSIALSIKGTKIPKLNRAFYYMVGASLLRAFYVVLENMC